MPDAEHATPRKASWWQVARTMFWALFMIGRKDTWEKGGARITMFQAVVGAGIALVAVVVILVLLVVVATR